MFEGIRGETMSEKEIIEIINRDYKGLEFDHIEYNERYKDYELHFKGIIGNDSNFMKHQYFCLGVHLNVNFREVCAKYDNEERETSISRTDEVDHED